MFGEHQALRLDATAHTPAVVQHSSPHGEDQIRAEAEPSHHQPHEPVRIDNGADPLEQKPKTPPSPSPPPPPESRIPTKPSQRTHHHHHHHQHPAAASSNLTSTIPTRFWSSAQRQSNHHKAHHHHATPSKGDLPAPLSSSSSSEPSAKQTPLLSQPAEGEESGGSGSGPIPHLPAAVQRYQESRKALQEATKFVPHLLKYFQGKVALVGNSSSGSNHRDGEPTQRKGVSGTERGSLFGSGHPHEDGNVAIPVIEISSNAADAPFTMEEDVDDHVPDPGTMSATPPHIDSGTTGSLPPVLISCSPPEAVVVPWHQPHPTTTTQQKQTAAEEGNNNNNNNNTWAMGNLTPFRQVNGAVLRGEGGGGSRLSLTAAFSSRRGSGVDPPSQQQEDETAAPEGENGSPVAGQAPQRRRSSAAHSVLLSPERSPSAAGANVALLATPQELQMISLHVNDLYYARRDLPSLTESRRPSTLSDAHRSPSSRRSMDRSTELQSRNSVALSVLDGEPSYGDDNTRNAPRSTQIPEYSFEQALAAWKRHSMSREGAHEGDSPSSPAPPPTLTQLRVLLASFERELQHWFVGLPSYRDVLTDLQRVCHDTIQKELNQATQWVAEEERKAFDTAVKELSGPYRKRMEELQFRADMFRCRLQEREARREERAKEEAEEVEAFTKRIRAARAAHEERQLQIDINNERIEVLTQKSRELRVQVRDSASTEQEIEQLLASSEIHTKRKSELVGRIRTLLDSIDPAVADLREQYAKSEKQLHEMHNKFLTVQRHAQQLTTKLKEHEEELHQITMQNETLCDERALWSDRREVIEMRALANHTPRPNYNGLLQWESVHGSLSYAVTASASTTNGTSQQVGGSAGGLGATSSLRTMTTADAEPEPFTPMLFEGGGPQRSRNRSSSVAPQTPLDNVRLETGRESFSSVANFATSMNAVSPRLSPASPQRAKSGLASPQAFHSMRGSPKTTASGGGKHAAAPQFIPIPPLSDFVSELRGVVAVVGDLNSTAASTSASPSSSLSSSQIIDIALKRLQQLMNASRRAIEEALKMSLVMQPLLAAVPRHTIAYDQTQWSNKVFAEFLYVPLHAPFIKKDVNNNSTAIGGGSRGGSESLSSSSSPLRQKGGNLSSSHHHQLTAPPPLFRANRLVLYPSSLLVPNASFAVQKGNSTATGSSPTTTPTTTTTTTSGAISSTSAPTTTSSLTAATEAKYSAGNVLTTEQLKEQLRAHTPWIVTLPTSGKLNQITTERFALQMLSALPVILGNVPILISVGGGASGGGLASTTSAANFTSFGGTATASSFFSSEFSSPSAYLSTVEATQLAESQVTAFSGAPATQPTLMLMFAAIEDALLKWIRALERSGGIPSLFGELAGPGQSPASVFGPSFLASLRLHAPRSSIAQCALDVIACKLPYSIGEHVQSHLHAWLSSCEGTDSGSSTRGGGGGTSSASPTGNNNNNNSAGGGSAFGPSGGGAAGGGGVVGTAWGQFAINGSIPQRTALMALSKTYLRDTAFSSEQLCSARYVLSNDLASSGATLRPSQLFDFGDFSGTKRQCGSFLRLVMEQFRSQHLCLSARLETIACDLAKVSPTLCQAVVPEALFLQAIEQFRVDAELLLSTNGLRYPSNAAGGSNRRMIGLSHRAFSDAVAMYQLPKFDAMAVQVVDTNAYSGAGSSGGSPLLHQQTSAAMGGGGGSSTVSGSYSPSGATEGGGGGGAGGMHSSSQQQSHSSGKTDYWLLDSLLAVIRVVPLRIVEK